MIGEIGEAEKRGKTRQEISKIDAQTAVLETQRKSEKAQADAELTTTQTRLNMGINLAQIQATRQAEAKDAELQRDVETKRAEMELERMRATDLVHAKIEKESAQQKADAKFYADTRGADGTLYKQRQDAEAACKYPRSPTSPLRSVLHSLIHWILGIIVLSKILIGRLCYRFPCHEGSRGGIIYKNERG